MPELPEVELTRRNLETWLGGRKLTRVEVPRTRIVRGSKPGELERLLDGHKVRAVERRGKWLRLTLDRGALFSHLGMTGKWVIRPPDAPAERSERARLDAGKTSVRYLDPRMFGRLVPSPSGAPIDEWRELGPDPLADEIDPAALAARLSKIRRSIKEALMDQSVLAGVGNIQAAEALHRARIHPKTPAAELDGKKVRALLRAVRDSIDDTLAREESPELTYVEEPGAPNPFRIYGRAGEPCPRCGGTIARFELGGRGTYYCPKCQVR